MPEPLKPFRSGIVPGKKCCEIKDGKIVRMFWEYPGDERVFSHERVFDRWEEISPGEDYSKQEWLTAHGFHYNNVIRDGVRPLRAT